MATTWTTETKDPGAYADVNGVDTFASSLFAAVTLGFLDSQRADS